ncbi:hypothetical protein F2Q70_00012453 [Brassica cretica]|uniref:NOA1/YqeH-like C-terminal domain-containing protein n=1 Tax=Brassica cretica TaxID=69181 RepID=A0A8S9MCS0_BRACR|nr:hypothetical protein F2Q70_00012453 [Brassica cretica]
MALRALSTFPSLPRRFTRRDPTLTVIHRNPTTSIVCKSISTSESTVSLSERDGFAAAAPTPGERFLENQRAHQAQTLVKKELKREKKKKKDESVRKVVDTSVSCCYGCGAPLQTSDVDSPGFVDLVTYDLKKKHHQLRTVICGRCQLLSHGHMITAVGGNGGYAGGKQFVSADELREKLSHLRHEKALIVKLISTLPTQSSSSPEGESLNGYTFFWGGLVRIDILKALPETRFTFYGPKALEIHVVPTKTATEFYQKEVGVLLTPPSGKDQIQEWKGLQSHRLLRIEFNDPKRPASDVAISGLGWISIEPIRRVRDSEPRDLEEAEHEIRVCVSVPKPVEVFIRPTLPIGTSGAEWYQYRDLSDKEEEVRPKWYF